MNIALATNEKRSLAVKFYDKFGCSGLNKPGLELVINNPAIVHVQETVTPAPTLYRAKVIAQAWSVKRKGSHAYNRYTEMENYILNHKGDRLTWREIFINTSYRYSDYVHDLNKGFVS